tara:strand:+ start:8599 stop:9912 length:1314 start_codon:yes stop_codon:yes gene_type:complete
MTAFGSFWIVICICTFFLPLRYLGALLICSCIFQSAGVIDLGEGRTVFPILITEGILFIRVFFLSLFKSKLLVNQVLRYLIYFVSFAILTSFFLPSIFSGMVKVFVYGVGVDTNLRRGGEYLRPANSNIIQSIYLIIHLIACVCLVNIPVNSSKNNFNFYLKALVVTILVVVVIGFWEFISKTTGFIYFPKSFFINSDSSLSEQTTMGGLMRLNSTFLEPSFAGAFLAGAFWVLWTLENFRFSKLLAAITFVALVLNLSGTGLISFCFGGIIYFLINDLKKALRFLVIIIIATALIYTLPYFEFITRLISEKTDSQSGKVRSSTIAYSINLFIETYGVGVGLGSHRGASFLTATLSTVGIIGTYLFFKFYRKIMLVVLALSKLNRNYMVVFYFGTVLLFAQILAIPDLSFTPFWMWIFTAILLFNSKQQYEANSTKI